MLMFFGTAAQAQQAGQSNSGGLEAPVYYQANDSIIADVPRQIVRLYGEANVTYLDIELNADYIEIDISKNEVMATYTLDTAGLPVGKPLFNSAGEESSCDYMRYNFKTKKGYIREVRAQQDEGYIHMAESKIHPNEEIHFKNGKFTTCDKENPHYHFKLTKAVVVPDKRVVSGPVFMKLFKVPLPLAAPFAWFPNSDSKQHGIIIPQFVNTAQYGFGLQNFGYYIPLGDHWETYFYGTIFTTGRFGVENQTTYLKKYKYRGNMGVKFEQFRGRFYDTTITNKWSIIWRHTQDSKAHPTLKFSTDINFKSDNNGKSSLNTINSEYFDNQFNSSIKLSKRWRLGKFSGSSGLNASLRQNSVSNSYTLDLPSFNLSVARFNLGVLRGKKAVGDSPLNKINVTYSMNARNFIQAPDSIFNQDYYQNINDYALNGVQHNTTVQSNLRLLGGRFTFTPSATYKEFWNFQYEERDWNATDQKVDTIDHRGFQSSREISARGGLNSNFFGYYKFIGKRQVKFRHVASPSASFTFRPDIGLHELIQTDTNGTEKYYSPFENSLYREPGQGNSASMSFGLNNTFEMKRKDMRDTVNETFISNKLIDALSINGSYNFLKDSMKLSNFALAFRTSKFLNVFSFQSSAVLSPYGFDNVGIDTSAYAWSTGQGIGRIKSANAVVNANFTNRNGRKKQKELDKSTEDNANANSNATNPKPSFEIPWQVNLSYNINYTRLTQTVSDVQLDTFKLVQTIRLDGDFNINKKWKFSYLMNYDLQAGAVTNYNFNIWRDLHCWEAALQWGQYGKWSDKNFTFLFRVNIKASMFQDIKLEYNQPPFFF
ncbi:LPS-assembly protein LptD [Crocinitomix catalasitica]|nr:LPS-assembly protein LptD [Crocinitomix catalasitica]